MNSINESIKIMNKIDESKTLKELKQESRVFYEKQILEEQQVIKEGWDKLNESILDDEYKGLTIAKIRVIVSQIEWASKRIGSHEVNLLENRLWLIQNKDEKFANAPINIQV